MKDLSRRSFSFIFLFLLLSSLLSIAQAASSNPADGTYLPPLNTFITVPPNTELNSAYQFGVVPTTFTTFYGILEINTVHYFTVDITDPSQVIRVTLFRSVDPSASEFFPGVVFMGPDRLNIDKSNEFPGYFPNIVQIPEGYDTYVRFNNEKKDFTPIYVGLMPFAWYQMLSFNATNLEIGKYVLAVFNSEIANPTAGGYALAIGEEITLTFDIFMLGPFNAFYIYEWQGWAPGLILLPYWIIIGIALFIIGHQTFWRGNSPRSWYSMFVCIGGYLTLGSGCVVIGQLAYSFLQVPTPVSTSLITVAITCGMFVGPLFCGILMVFFGLMHRANYLVRFCVMFLAVGSCLVWASYYIGPGIALIGALFMPSTKWIPFHKCCKWLKDIDDENRETTIKAEADIDWDKKYEEEETKNKEAAKRAAAQAAAAEKQAAAAQAARDADDDEIQIAMVGPEGDIPAGEGKTDEIAKSSFKNDEAFPVDAPIHFAAADDTESEDTDPGSPLPSSMAASSSGVHQPNFREGVDD